MKLAHPGRTVPHPPPATTALKGLDTAEIVFRRHRFRIDAIVVVPLGHRAIRPPADDPVDNLLAGREATEYLYQLGHRRIAHVTTFKGERFGDERAEAFLAEMAKRSLPVKTEWIYRDECFRSGGPLVPFLERLFSEPDRPTAVSCGNDLIALRVMTALERQGIRIPEEVSVIGYSDLSFGVACEPELTTIHQPFDRMGETAVKLALDGGEREVLIPTELVVRGSTASPC